MQDETKLPTDAGESIAGECDATRCCASENCAERDSAKADEAQVSANRPYSVARDVTVMALVVACNVALEMSLGTALHAMNFALTGSLMVVLNALAYALAFCYYPHFGRVTAMGIATSLVMFIMGGGFKFTVMPAIIGEAVIIDAVLSLMGVTKRGFLLCGGCASLSALGFKLFNMQVFRGVPVDVALTKIADFTRIECGMAAILGLTVLYRLAVGVFFAWILWGILQRLRRMLYPMLAMPCN